MPPCGTDRRQVKPNPDVVSVQQDCPVSNLESDSVSRRLSIDETVPEESLISMTPRSTSLFSKIRHPLHGWCDDWKSRMLKWPTEFSAALLGHWLRECGWPSPDRGQLTVCMPEVAVCPTCLIIGMSLEEFARMACLTIVSQRLAGAASVRFDNEESGEDDFLRRQASGWYLDQSLADRSEQSGFRETPFDGVRYIPIQEAFQELLVSSPGRCRCVIPWDSEESLLENWLLPGGALSKAISISPSIVLCALRFRRVDDVRHTCAKNLEKLFINISIVFPHTVVLLLFLQGMLLSAFILCLPKLITNPLMPIWKHNIVLCGAHQTLPIF